MSTRAWDLLRYSISPFARLDAATAFQGKVAARWQPSSTGGNVWRPKATAALPTRMFPHNWLWFSSRHGVNQSRLHFRNCWSLFEHIRSHRRPRNCGFDVGLNCCGIRICLQIQSPLRAVLIYIPGVTSLSKSSGLKMSTGICHVLFFSSFFNSRAKPALRLPPYGWSEWSRKWGEGEKRPNAPRVLNIRPTERHMSDECKSAPAAMTHLVQGYYRVLRSHREWIRAI